MISETVNFLFISNYRTMLFSIKALPTK
jgi:hypothetical protein